MTSSYSTIESQTFTLVHAKYIASKVATDLKRIQRFYGSPSDQWINDYEGELIHFLKNDIVNDVIYGFQRNGKWTEVSLRYKALPGGNLTADDDPGKIQPNLDIAGASFTSFLRYNSKWDELSEQEKQKIKVGSPLQRNSGSAPPLEIGQWSDDLSYVAGGRGLGRATVKKG